MAPSPGRRSRAAAMPPATRRRWFWCCLLAATVAAVGVIWWHAHRRSDEAYDAAALTFDGASEQLRQTVVVPTLDSSIPEGKSVIWCASFQLAWNRLKEDVVKGPVRLANAQPLADLLNRADGSEDDLDRDSVYAAAGLAADGIVER